MSTMTAIATTRFGTLEIDPDAVIRFPEGLIGLPGNEYVLVPARRGPFVWLQSLSDGSLALPLTDPSRFFPDFELALEAEPAAGADVYVTVRATAEASDCTANLKAPIVIAEREAHQVVNLWPAAVLRAPLFGPRSAD